MLSISKFERLRPGCFLCLKDSSSDFPHFPPLLLQVSILTSPLHTGFSRAPLSSTLYFLTPVLHNLFSYHCPPKEAFMYFIFVIASSHEILIPQIYFLLFIYCALWRATNHCTICILTPKCNFYLFRGDIALNDNAYLILISFSSLHLSLPDISTYLLAFTSTKL